MKKNNKGFTLLEMVIVVAIMGRVLVSVGWGGNVIFANIFTAADTVNPTDSQNSSNASLVESLILILNVATALSLSVFTKIL